MVRQIRPSLSLPPLRIERHPRKTRWENRLSGVFGVVLGAMGAFYLFSPILESPPTSVVYEHPNAQYQRRVKDKFKREIGYASIEVKEGDICTVGCGSLGDPFNHEGKGIIVSGVDGNGNARKFAFDTNGTALWEGAAIGERFQVFVIRKDGKMRIRVAERDMRGVGWVLARDFTNVKDFKQWIEEQLPSKLHASVVVILPP